jgi:protein-tyrosine kinase
MNHAALENIHRHIDKLEAKVLQLRRESDAEPYISNPSPSPAAEAPAGTSRKQAPFLFEDNNARRQPTIADVLAATKRPWIIELDIEHLQSRKIVAHNGADPRSRPYDMLRTQVLQVANHNGWRVLGVTSPLPKCGKTLSAINLAFSTARQPDQQVLLVDLDLRQPQIASYLGIAPTNGGVLDLLKRRSNLEASVVPVSVGKRPVLILPTAATEDSSDLIGATRTLLHEMRNRYSTHLIILNLPSMLTSDDVLTILPWLDCVMLVAAVGSSKVDEIEECMRHLRGNQLVRVVVNKARDNVSYS